jgi:fructose-1-phosphate kinase PfkB-like protein
MKKINKILDMISFHLNKLDDYCFELIKFLQENNKVIVIDDSTRELKLFLLMASKKHRIPFIIEKENEKEIVKFLIKEEKIKNDFQFYS